MSILREIIRQAVSYYVYEEYERFTALISNQRNFRDIAQIMDYTVDMLENRFSSFLFMVLDLGHSDIKRSSVRIAICLQNSLGVLEHIEQMYKKRKKKN